MTVYLDISAKRIQAYLARTPRLRGRRGASALLEYERLHEWTKDVWSGHAQINEDGKQTDGVLSLRFTDSDPIPRVRVVRFPRDLGFGLVDLLGVVFVGGQAKGPECRFGWTGSAVCRGLMAWSGRCREGAYAGEDEFEQVIARW